MGYCPRRAVDGRFGSGRTLPRSAFHPRYVARSLWIAGRCDRELGAVLFFPQVQPLRRVFPDVLGELDFLLQRDPGTDIGKAQILVAQTSVCGLYE
jgi:hypothetical protein